jgi:hypothetical protein
MNVPEAEPPIIKFEPNRTSDDVVDCVGKPATDNGENGLLVNIPTLPFAFTRNFSAFVVPTFECNVMIGDVFVVVPATAISACPPEAVNPVADEVNTAPPADPVTTASALPGAFVPIPTLPANVEVAENQLVPVTVSVLLTLLDPMPTCPPVNVEVAVTANTPDTGLNVKLSDDVNVDDPAPVKNAICVEVPEPDMPLAEPQSDPVPDTTPDASTRRHCVEPEIFDMVRFDVVALVTDTPVPDPVVKLSVGNVPYPEAVMLVEETLVSAALVLLSVGNVPYPEAVMLVEETAAKVDWPVTRIYPESVWLVPEALVKLSVGNVPYPEAVMLVEETLVSAALVLLSVGNVPYPEAVMLVEETAAKVDWPVTVTGPVNVEVAVTANTPDTGLNVRLSDDVNVDDPAPVKNAICVEVPEPDMPLAEPQSDPVPDTTPDASTRRHCVEPEMFDMVRFDVVALVTDTPVPDPVVKLSVGKVPYPEAVMLVVDALVAETVPSVVFPVTARYPESVWLVPEALVKLSVGKVPYPEAVILVEETLVSAALVLLSVGNVPYPEAVMLVEETAAKVDWPVTRIYPESVWLVPEALVKLSVGNVPYPEAVMLVPDADPNVNCPLIIVEDENVEVD